MLLGNADLRVTIPGAASAVVRGWSYNLQTLIRRQPSAALAARISSSHRSRSSVAPAPSPTAVTTSSAAQRT